MNRPYQDLAEAIIVRGANDWREATLRLKRRPGHKTSREKKAECERFFRSAWFTELTSIDGELILRMLEEEMAS